jgi:hypothetical protein
MRALHFSVAYRTRGTQKAPAQAHVRYITRAQASAAEHVGYVTRTTQHTREDLVASGYGNLPAWAQGDPAALSMRRPYEANELLPGVGVRPSANPLLLGVGTLAWTKSPH